MNVVFRIVVLHTSRLYLRSKQMAATTFIIHCNLAYIIGGNKYTYLPKNNKNILNICILFVCFLNNKCCLLQKWLSSVPAAIDTDKTPDNYCVTEVIATEVIETEVSFIYIISDICNKFIELHPQNWFLRSFMDTLYEIRII